MKIKKEKFTSYFSDQKELFTKLEKSFAPVKKDKFYIFVQMRVIFS